MTMRALEAAEAAAKPIASTSPCCTCRRSSRSTKQTILAKPRAAGGMVVVAENHTVIGGLGEAVAGVLLRAGVAPAVPPDRAARRVPRRRRAADAARPLRHLRRSDGRVASRAGCSRHGRCAVPLGCAGSTRVTAPRVCCAARLRRGRGGNPLLGGNGAGKSTLLKIATGTVRRDAGRLLYRGLDIDTAEGQRRATWASRWSTRKWPCSRTHRSREHPPAASQTRRHPVPSPRRRASGPRRARGN